MSPILILLALMISLPLSLSQFVYDHRSVSENVNIVLVGPAIKAIAVDVCLTPSNHIAELPSVRSQLLWNSWR